MSDHCEVFIWCRKTDLKAFEDVGFQVFDDTYPSNFIQVNQEQTNYRPEEWPDTLYAGYHLSGHAYGPHDFFKRPGQKAHCWETGFDGGLVIPIPNGKYAPTKNTLAQLQKFLDGQDSVMRELGLYAQGDLIPR